MYCKRLTRYLIEIFWVFCALKRQKLRPFIGIKEHCIKIKRDIFPEEYWINVRQYKRNRIMSIQLIPHWAIKNRNKLFRQRFLSLYLTWECSSDFLSDLSKKCINIFTETKNQHTIFVSDVRQIKQKFCQVKKNISFKSFFTNAKWGFHCLFWWIYAC